ncbi:hypothetical protein L208DRAFT_1239117 [Tricholoma matsutake]|nr:hypothetical protein L208DRAFT_1239117 [Tricholoma matsutake 945]
MTFKILQEILLHVDPSRSTVNNNARVPFVPLTAVQHPAPVPASNDLQSLSPPLVPALPICAISKSSSRKPGKVANIPTIILGDSTQLRLTLAEIPDPPAVSFVDNIPWLNQMWDNTSIHWCNKSWLHIQGHSIALSHWPVLYRYSGAPMWKGIKGKFFEWKVGKLRSRGSD